MFRKVLLSTACALMLVSPATAPAFAHGHGGHRGFHGGHHFAGHAWRGGGHYYHRGWHSRGGWHGGGGWIAPAIGLGILGGAIAGTLFAPTCGWVFTGYYDYNGNPINQYICN